MCLVATGNPWCCCVGRRRAPLAGAIRRAVVKDGTDFEYSLGSYRGRFLECLKSSTEAAGPGDDFDEYVECAIRVVAVFEEWPRIACSDGGRPLASGVVGIGESGTWMAGSCGQLEQKKRRGLAASWIERIAAASLVILGARLQDRHNLLVHAES